MILVFPRGRYMDSLVCWPERGLTGALAVFWGRRS